MKLANFNPNNLVYFDNLDLKKNVLFGIEIEAKGFSLTKVQKAFKDKKFDKWIAKTDSSVTSYLLNRKIGGEVVSKPFCSNNTDTWNEISGICNFLKNNEAYMHESCAGHIHIENKIFNYSAINVQKFLLLWQYYEDIMYKFLYGEYKSDRDNISTFAKPISGTLNKNFEDIKEMNWEELVPYMGMYNKTNGIKLTHIGVTDLNKKPTIEFRMPNGSLNENIWQNNINVILCFLLTAINKSYEEIDEFVNKDKYVHKTLSEYDDLDIDKAYTLCEFIFDNDLIKNNFMMQYSKNDMERFYR